MKDAEEIFEEIEKRFGYLAAESVDWQEFKAKYRKGKEAGLWD